MITRIRELLDARQLSPTQFADLIGVGRPVMSHILSERNKPSLEVVQKIIGAFPDISLPWLLAGTGPMLATATTSPAVSPTPSAPEVAPTPVLVPPTAAAVAPAPPISLPAATPRPVTASPPSTYPQPPRFRPEVGVSATPAHRKATPASRHQADAGLLAVPVSNAASSLPLETLATAAIAPAATKPVPSPLTPPVVAAPPATPPLVVAPAQAPSPPPVTTIVPSVANGTLGDLAMPAHEATASPTSLEAPATTPSPAAALSFLGEPGKAIRRIVIFYRDGSFSDFLPEAN